MTETLKLVIVLIKAKGHTLQLNTSNQSSSLDSRSTQIRLYTAIVRFTITYGCKVWPLTTRFEQKLRSFENQD